MITMSYDERKSRLVRVVFTMNTETVTTELTSNGWVVADVEVP